MDSSFNLMYILGFAALVGVIIAFVLLARKNPKGWFLLTISPIWYTFSALYGYVDFNGDLLQLFDSFTLSFIVSNGLTLIILIYGYLQWKKTKHVSYTTRTETFDILDSVAVEKTSLATKRLSTDNVIDPITFAIIIFVTLGFFKFGLIGYSIDQYSLLYHSTEVSYLLGFYLLAKNYIEGWIFLAASILIELAFGLLVGMPLPFRTLVYSLAQLLVYIWGYTEWKKFEEIKE